MSVVKKTKINLELQNQHSSKNKSENSIGSKTTSSSTDAPSSIPKKQGNPPSPPDVSVSISLKDLEL